MTGGRPPIRAGLTHLARLADRISRSLAWSPPRWRAQPFSWPDRGVSLPSSARQRADSGIDLNQVTSSYLDALGVNVVKGRPFLPEDRASSAKVAILNMPAHALSSAYPPVGRRVRFRSRPPSITRSLAWSRYGYESLRVAPETDGLLPLDSRSIGSPASPWRPSAVDDQGVVRITAK